MNNRVHRAFFGMWCIVWSTVLVSFDMWEMGYLFLAVGAFIFTTLWDGKP